MTERDDIDKIIAIKLFPGPRDVDYELIRAKGNRIEVGPIFGNNSVNPTCPQPAEDETVSRSRQWFKENGGV